MREIGSEFWQVEESDAGEQLFPENTQWYLSGRSALQAIIKELSWAKSVSMPAWCCNSMVKPFINAGFDVHFYPVFFENGLNQIIYTNCDVLFVMDYFGYTTNVNFKHECVIRDITHSLFSHTYTDANYYFGSLRKWCGIWTGGYAWTNDGHMLPIAEMGDNGFIIARHDAMERKRIYMEQHDGDHKEKGYLYDYETAENILDTVGIHIAAERDINIAKRLDISFIKRQRRINAEVLMRAFPDWLIFHELLDTDCPMFVPILVPQGKRDVLRRYLIDKEIYCPIHWPLSSYHDIDKSSRKIYEDELSLVCDQRYSEVDMQRMVDEIRMFMEGL